MLIVTMYQSPWFENPLSSMVHHGTAKGRYKIFPIGKTLFSYPDIFPYGVPERNSLYEAVFLYRFNSN